MKQLEEAVSLLTSFIPRYEISNTRVSQASAGWHIAHSLLVINSIVSALQKSDPADFKRSFSLPRLYVWFRGDIPRGRGKAPERVKPVGDITPEFLQELATKTRLALGELPKVQKNAHFKHPYFGMLNKKSTTWFLKIHTAHHNKIIQDILR